MDKDGEPLRKLDEAIRALKDAGYKFSEHTIIDQEVCGTHRDFSKRVIEIKCHTYLPPSEKPEGFFSKDGLEKPDPALIPRHS